VNDIDNMYEEKCSHSPSFAVSHGAHLKCQSTTRKWETGTIDKHEREQEHSARLARDSAKAQLAMVNAQNSALWRKGSIGGSQTPPNAQKGAEGHT